MTYLENIQARRAYLLAASTQDNADRIELLIGGSGVFKSPLTEACFLTWQARQPAFKVNALRQHFVDQTRPGTSNAANDNGAFLDEGVESDFEQWCQDTLTKILAAGPQELARLNPAEGETLQSWLDRSVLRADEAQAAPPVQTLAPAQESAIQAHLERLNNQQRQAQAVPPEVLRAGDAQLQARIATILTDRQHRLTTAEKEALNRLRERGFALVIYTPEELKTMTAPVQDLESCMAQAGNDFIDSNQKA